MTGRVQPLEDAAALVGGDARSVIVNAELDGTVAARYVDRDRRGRVLEGILDEVRDDLGEPFGIGVGGDRPSVGDAERDAPLTRGREEAFDRVVDDFTRIDRARRQRELVGVEPGQIEEVRHEPLEPFRFALDDVRGIDAIVTAFHRSVGNRRRVPLDGCQRRAQVVRDAEQERAFV